MKVKLKTFNILHVLFFLCFYLFNFSVISELLHVDYQTDYFEVFFKYLYLVINELTGKISASRVKCKVAPSMLWICGVCDSTHLKQTKGGGGDFMCTCGKRAATRRSVPLPSSLLLQIPSLKEELRIPLGP